MITQTLLFKKHACTCWDAAAIKRFTQQNRKEQHNFICTTWFFYTYLYFINTLESSRANVNKTSLCRCSSEYAIPKILLLKVYKCGRACRQHAVYEDQMLSQSRKENVGIQSRHCLLHFVFSIHGNLALRGHLSQYVYTVCMLAENISAFSLSFCGCRSILRVVF